MPRRRRDDELHIAARDVEMHKDRVWSSHPVQFRFGPNHGSGRDMEIQLSADEEAEARGGFRAGTMRKLCNMKRNVKIQSVTGAAARPATGPRRQPADPPLDIILQGMFQFDMQNYGASFHQEVNVLQPEPGRRSGSTELRNSDGAVRPASARAGRGAGAARRRRTALFVAGASSRLAATR